MRAANEIEFLTINPDFHANSPIVADNKNKYLDGYEIIDSRIIKDNFLKNKIINDLIKADKENNDKIANCFNPRHAIRIPHQPNIYIIICFQCSQASFQYLKESGSIMIQHSFDKNFDEHANSLGMKFQKE